MISEARLAEIADRVLAWDGWDHPAAKSYCLDVPDLTRALRAERERVAVPPPPVPLVDRDTGDET